MQNEKYYNYEKWEMENYRKKQMKKSHQLLNKSKIPENFNDEEERRKELKEAREILEKQQFRETITKMASDKDRREDMRRQDQLRAEMALAYKQGDLTTVRRIEKLLAPEEDGPTAKHPWA